MALRDLIDEDGEQWVVFAVQPTVSSRARGGTRADLAEGWLCFQSQAERRRIPGVPAGWETLEDGALLALLATAPVAPPVRRATRH